MIHLGKWQDAQWPDEVDCIITDPPYSERVHKGSNSVSDKKKQLTPSVIEYAALSSEEAFQWSRDFAGRIRYWMAILTDHASWPHWEAGAASAGLYTFQPIPLIIPGMGGARVAADGPASECVWMLVARTMRPIKDDFGRGKRAWGSLPGYYTTGFNDRNISNIKTRPGGKPLDLMQQIIRDYSRPGMLVADPCAGHATTLVAALQAGRRVWGAECDAKAHAAATERLARVVAQPQLITETKQSELL
jgi:DNA modification methylase